MSTTQEESAQKNAALKKIALERTGLLLAVLGFALVVVKVARASHLNSRTALTLVQLGGPLEVFLGALVAHLPLFLFVVSALCIWWGVGSFAQSRTVSSPHLGVAGILLFALILIPWPLAAVLVVVGVARWFIAAKRTVSSHEEASSSRSRGVYFLVGVVTVFLVADSQMWLPSERFTVRDETFAGYALEEGAWTALLVDDTREVLHIRSEELQDRTPCRSQEETFELEGFPSLLQLAIGEDSELPEPVC